MALFVQMSILYRPNPAKHPTLAACQHGLGFFSVYRRAQTSAFRRCRQTMSPDSPFPPDPLSELHRSLRAATRSDHLAVDRLVGRLDLARDDGYGRFLSIHHAVLQNLRSEWRPEDQEDFRAMSRRLQNDLRVLGFPAASPQLMARARLAQGNQLGIAYVIRGSRFGTNALRPRIPLHFSASYLNFVPALSWAQFLAQLGNVPNAADSETGEASIEGAKIAFGLYSRLLMEALV
jgi:heme oxygenase (biliverdin-IX-beta and delta-forming)